MAQPDYLQDLRNYLNESACITPDMALRNYVKTNHLTLAEDSTPLRVHFDEVHDYVGKEVGVTKWFPITQSRMNSFADITGDYQFLHIDRERTARETCYDGTIAHGMLTLSLLTTFALNGSLKIRDTQQCIIYGLDRVRFLNPVRMGSRIRGRFKLLGAEERRPGEILLRHAVTIEIENQEKPALIADWLILAVL